MQVTTTQNHAAASQLAQMQFEKIRRQNAEIARLNRLVAHLASKLAADPTEYEIHHGRLRRAEKPTIWVEVDT